jgi:sulfate/thiosulfate transport system ATP-binding protein
LRPAIATDGRALDIDVIDVRKGFGAHPALLGVDLRIRRGELVALLGPSGSGKTTLLRVIAGLEIPDSGKVIMGGQETANVSIQNRGVGFVFQNYALFKHMTVFDNIAYGLVIRPAVRRLPKAQIRERVSSLLELVQLGGLERRYPAQLSGGQRQRVALARALAIEPKVLLLDEPFGALDAKVRKDLRRWLREIHRKTGQTTIFVTHDQDEALELAERVAILNQGRIERSVLPTTSTTAPRLLLSRPSSASRTRSTLIFTTAAPRWEHKASSCARSPPGRTGSIVRPPKGRAHSRAGRRRCGGDCNFSSPHRRRTTS